MKLRESAIVVDAIGEAVVDGVDRACTRWYKHRDQDGASETLASAEFRAHVVETLSEEIGERLARILVFEDLEAPERHEGDDPT